MTKEKFLKELEKKLNVLNEKERKDILDEYGSTIEEKVKNGKTEEEAVKDFGNIDKLAEEILEAYKIDPKYKSSGFEKMINDGETVIKDCADTLAKETKNLIDNFKSKNQEINLPLVFEILIKIFITLICIGILQIPFKLFTHLGYSILSSVFNPFGDILKAILSILLTVIYLIVIILLVSALFKEYFVQEAKPKEEPKSKTKQNLKKDSKPETKKANQAVDNQIITIIMTIVKILTVIFVLIPLVCVNIFFITGLVVSIYYWVKGIDLLGLTLLFAGLSTLTTWLIHVIKNILNNKRIKPYLLIAGIILTVTGGVLFSVMISHIDYIDEAPAINNTETIENTYSIDKRVYINNYGNKINKTVDNTLEDGALKLQIKYDKKYYDITINENKNYEFDEEDCKKYELCGTYDYFNVYSSSDDTRKIQPLYDLFIENLKHNKVYNYTKIYNPEIEVYANEKTISLIQTNIVK